MMLESRWKSAKRYHMSAHTLMERHRRKYGILGLQAINVHVLTKGASLRNALCLSIVV